jgi:hypothetical protein
MAVIKKYFDIKNGKSVEAAVSALASEAVVPAHTEGEEDEEAAQLAEVHPAEIHADRLAAPSSGEVLPAGGVSAGNGSSAADVSPARGVSPVGVSPPGGASPGRGASAAPSQTSGTPLGSLMDGDSDVPEKSAAAPVRAGSITIPAVAAPARGARAVHRTEGG